MKLNLTTIAILALATSTVAAAAPRTQVYFMDNCTKAKTAVTMPGGTSIVVRVQNLQPGMPFYIKGYIEPTGNAESDVPNARDRIDFSEKIKAVPANGVVLYSKTVELKYTRSEMATSLSRRVWNVNVQWVQNGKERQSGGGFSTIYSSQNAAQRFYKLRGLGICRWETPPAIVSKYHYNEGNQEMSVSREYTIEDSSTLTKGIDFGIVPDNAGAGSTTSYTPLLVQSAFDYGWLFGGIQTERQLSQTSGISQTWSIGKGQGGFFVQRLSFNRVPADEYALDTSGSCPRWTVARTGYLDIGSPLLEFNVIPQSMAGTPESANEFMERMRPTFDSCEPLQNSININDARVPGSTPDDILLFFPSPSHQELK